jgi:hypothetical protein
MIALQCLLSIRIGRSDSKTNVFRSRTTMIEATRDLFPAGSSPQIMLSKRDVGSIKSSISTRLPAGSLADGEEKMAADVGYI